MTLPLVAAQAWTPRQNGLFLGALNPLVCLDRLPAGTWILRQNGTLPERSKSNLEGESPLSADALLARFCLFGLACQNKDPLFYFRGNPQPCIVQTRYKRFNFIYQTLRLGFQ